MHGRFLVHALCRSAGINPRHCFCLRCIAARTGVYRRTRVQVGHSVYANVHVLGIRISRRFAFDVPSTTPPGLICAAGKVARVDHGMRLPGFAAFERQDHARPGHGAGRSRKRLVAST
ncbi:MAG: hypothetical protein OXF27_00280 [Acidobacteria bacterium]|nr:hypothetical protein [Acidobacteriota bacterium]